MQIDGLIEIDGARLRSLRERQTLTPKELGLISGLSRFTIDRLMAMLTRQGGVSQDVAPSDPKQYRQMYLDAQHQLTELQSMVSMRLIQRAKRVWDYAPVLKNIVKAVVKKTL